MKNLLIGIFLLLATYSYSQDLGVGKKVDIEPADTSSFVVIENDSLYDVYSDEFRRKIEFHRRDVNYFWEPEEGLKVLIKKEE